MILERDADIIFYKHLQLYRNKYNNAPVCCVLLYRFFKLSRVLDFLGFFLSLCECLIYYF